MMDKLITDFTKQISEAYAIGQKAQLSVPKQSIKNVLVCGLGGSGIGGDIVKMLVKNELKIPIDICKSYDIPTYVNKETLVIISSYSGNTEETINTMQQAIQTQAHIVCITSGGKIQQLAKENQLDCIIIPGGMPPRTCLGYSMIQQLFVLYHLGFIEYDFQADIMSSINLLDSQEAEIKNLAQKAAFFLLNKIPVIYSGDEMEAVAVRFRQQINENSKMLCWHHVIPEMNHNELVGWKTKNENLAVIFFRNETDHLRVQHRMKINQEIIKKYTPHIMEINSKGSSQIQRALYLVHLGDWISYYLAEQKGIDSVEVSVIDFLKGELAKI